MKRMRFFPLFVLFFLAAAGAARVAGADIMNGSMELDYNNYRATTRDSEGNVQTRVNANEFTQVYSMSLNVNPLPTVYVAGGLLLFQDASRSTTNELGSKSSERTLQPSLRISYRDPYNVFLSEAGYSTRDTSQRGANGQTQQFFNEEYHVTLGWTPPPSPSLALPALNMQAARNIFYDKNPTSQDVTTDTINFGLHYTPLARLEAGYNFLGTDMTNKFTDIETRSDMQNVRLGYSQTFWKGRVSASTSYSASFASYETMQKQQTVEAVTLQLFPFAGLSAVTDTPPLDTLAANALLIDGNATASANIDIGSALSTAGDARWREMAFDFGVPTEINNVLVWVNQQLNETIASSFLWTVYTSPDNANWTQVPLVHAQFGPFQSRFVLDFQTVTARYLKVATRPLSLAVQGANNPGNQHIYITEIQGFANTTNAAPSRNSEAKQANQVYGLNVTTQIVPGVSHVFTYSLMQGQVHSNGIDSSSRQYNLSNGLNVTRRFNVGPGMTASCQFARQDMMNSEGKRQGAYSYGAVLTAVPLPTLRGSLTYGGSTSDDGSSSDGLTLNTVADLYPGVNLHSMAGVQAGDSETGGRTRGANFLTALGVAPRRDLSLSLTYRTNRTRTFGQTGAVNANSLSQYDLSATYRPFETLFLTSSASFIERSQMKSIRARNYGLNWSPFLTGALQFGFFYNESVQLDADAKTTAYGPTLTWMLFPRSALELSYSRTKSDYPQGATETGSFNAQFRMGF